MLLIQYPEEINGENIKKQIIELENTAWKPSELENDINFPSSPNTYVTSFILIENNHVISHAAIRKTLFIHNGKEYLAYGLSEVVTHPNYQKKGLGLKIIKKAAEFIINKSPDISIFTCDPLKINFYKKAGWQPFTSTCFVGGTKSNPFRSDSLGLTTMIMFLSDKANFNKHEFENTDIIFELGEKQLW